MLKKVLLFIMFAFCSVLTLSSCSEPASIYGKFSQEKIVLDIGEQINIKSKLSLTGVDFQDIEISFSNPNILHKEGDNYIAKESGTTFVFANYNDTTLAQTQVIVNYVFSTPNIIKISKQGVLQWQESSAIVDGKVVNAKEYIVKIDDNRQFIVDENKLDFAEYGFGYGRYKVQIIALDDETNYITQSQATQSVTVVYDYMSTISRLYVDVPEEYQGLETTISWDEIEDAVYDIFIDGYKINKDKLKTSSFTYDFGRFASGQINLNIIAYDVNNEKIELSTPYILVKHDIASADFMFDGVDGYLYINDSQQANGYIVHYSDNNGVSGQKIIQANQEEFLNELENGIYNISVQVLGGEKDGQYYLNSNASQSIKFAKLSMPNPTITVEGQIVEIKFEEDYDEYVESYLVKVGSYEIVHNIKDGYTFTLPEIFIEGENTIEVYALPVSDSSSSSGVKSYTIDDNSSNNVLTSKPFVYNIYKLSQISDITHQFADEQNTDSQLIFKNVEFANSFNVYINDNLVSDVSIQIGENYTTLSFKNLKNYLSRENKQNQIKIECFRNNGDSINSFGYKTLTILDAVQSTESENGQYRWQAVEGEVEYKYTIYKTDENYLNEKEFTSATTSNLMLNEKLPFGYYKIEIVSLSTNENLYLDSNFVDEQEILVDQFFVEEQISTPEIELLEINEQNNVVYKIKIKDVEYAGYISIIIDGVEVDGFKVDKNAEGYTGEFTRTLIKSGSSEFETFDQEKTYVLEVVAKAGSYFDNNLHPDSEPATINITRIAKPTINVDEVYSNTLFGVEGEKGKKIEENIIPQNQEDCVDHYEIYINGEKVNTDNQGSYNIINRPEYFQMKVVAIAKDKEGNNYYLDSSPKEFTVQRLASPTGFNYQNGTISYSNLELQNIENYFVEIELFVESGNRTINFFTNSLEQEFDLQEKINEFITNAEFYNEFRQASKLGVKVWAYTEPKFLSENNLILQSLPATTTGGATQIFVEEMSAPILSFDANGTQDILSWNSVGENTVYDIYKNNVVVKENYSGTSINLSSIIEDTNLTVENAEFKVVAKNPKYLNSTNSNIITIGKIKTVDNVVISKNENSSWVAVLNLSDNAQIGRIEKVLVNDEEINYMTGQSKIYIDLSNYLEESYKLSIQFVAKNNTTEQIYYLNSDKFEINLTNIKNKSLDAKIANDKISWTSPYQQWQEELGIVSYKISIQANDTMFAINNYTKTEILLSELESLVNTSFNSDNKINISIYSQLADFSSLISQTIYYGEIEQTNLQVNKMASVNQAQVSIVLSGSSDKLTQYKDSQIALKFENIWDGDISFDIVINDSDYSFEGLTLTGAYIGCNLTLEDNYYTIFINNSLFELEGENKIYLKVNKQNLISSDVKEYSITRNSNIENAVVDNHGLLTVTYGEIATNSLLLKLTIGSEVIYQQYSPLQTEIDLQELLSSKSGNITIELLVVDSNLNVLSNLSTYAIFNSKLAKVESIEIFNDGQMYFNLASASFVGEENNIEFIIKKDGGEEIQFYPTMVEGNAFKYEYSLDQLANIFNFKQAGNYTLSIANRERGYINSDFVDFKFGFAVEKIDSVLRQREALNKDFVIFKTLDTENDGLTTVGFRFVIKNHLNEIVANKNIKLSDDNSIIGYWDGNTNKFLLSQPSYSEEEQQAKVYKCFAFSINDLFNELGHGVYSLEVARVAKEADVYTLFDTKVFEIVKLNNVIEDAMSTLNVRIYQNVLYWTWQKPEEEWLPNNFFPSVYYITIWAKDNEIQKQYITSSSNKLDLTTLKLSSGDNFITIQAVSDNKDILASSTLENALSFYKYGVSKSLSLDSGKIVFDLSNNGQLDKTIDFVSVFDTSVTGENLANNLASIGADGFKDIYDFQSGTVNQQTIKLKFVATDSNGSNENGKVYYSTVNAMNLLPKFSVNSIDFITQLQNYIDENDGTDNTMNFEALKSFAKLIEKSSFGITDGEILFDDFGQQIPSGYYNVSTIQTTSNPESSFVDSDPSKSLLIYVASAPTMTIGNSYDSETGEELYQATYNCVNTVDDFASMVKATSYTMNFRAKTENGESSLYKFDISNVSNWTIEYNGQMLNGVIEGNENSFTINFTALGDYILDGVYLIDKAYEYNVYVYANGGANSCFGKNSKLNLVFLNLESKNISVVDGFVTITTSSNEVGSDILVKYKRKYAVGTSVSEEIKIVETDDYGKVILNDILKDYGEYEYVIFNVMGQLNQATKTMKLPSVSYGILNLYKLNTPILSTENNQLLVTAQAEDSNYGPFKFMVSSLDGYTKSENDYFNDETGNLGQLAYNHETLEQLPEITDVYFVSKTIDSINIDDYDNSGSNLPYFEKILNFGEQLIISSNKEQISLRKLPNITDLKLNKGNITWQEVEVTEIENAEIVYKVEVECYDDGNIDNIKTIETFWTKNNYFDTANVKTHFSQGNDFGFNFNIYAYVGKSADSGAELLEGGFIDISNAIQFVDDKFALYSSPTSRVGLTKQQAPEFYNQNQVYDGKIAILRKDDDNFSFNIKLIDSNSNRIDLVEGIDYIVDNNGIIKEEGNTSTKVYFISIVNNEYANGKAFSLEIYSYSDTTIKSDKITTTSLFKLKQLQEQNFNLMIENTDGVYKNILSFENYFESNIFNFQNNVYQIDIYKMTKEEESWKEEYKTTLTSENQIITNLDSDYLNNTFKFVVKPVSSSGKYLTSEEFIVSFFDGDNLIEENSFAYNQQQYKLQWSVNEQEKDYQYFVSLKYEDGSIEENYVEEFVSSEGKRTYFYQPNKMGKILQANLYAREKGFTIDENLNNSICMFTFAGQIESIEYKLFDSGSGTQSDPYIITNSQEFKNIAIRDSASNKVYFKLANTINLESNVFNQFVINKFYGELDGNGNTIELSISPSSSEIEQENSIIVDKDLTLGKTTAKLNMNKALSLFGSIEQNALIKNINIHLSFNDSNIQNLETTFVSGLAYQNFGTIQNINVNSVSLGTFDNLSSIALSGLVTLNSGIIQDCQINADIIAELPQKSVTLIYGSVAIINESKGRLIGCVNNGDIQITVSKDLTMVYVGGLVYENNNSYIYASGNNGIINILGNYSYDVSIAGIVVRNVNSQIDYVFNNGKITTSLTSTNNSSGIIFWQQFGKIGNIFESSDSGIITSSSNGSVDKLSNSAVYGYSNGSSFITGLTITKISTLENNQVFTYNAQYNLKIIVTGSETDKIYSVTLEKL